MFNAVVGAPNGNSNEDNLRNLHQQPETGIAKSAWSPLAILFLSLAGVHHERECHEVHIVREGQHQEYADQATKDKLIDHHIADDHSLKYDSKLGARKLLLNIFVKFDPKVAVPQDKEHLRSYP